MKYLFFDIECCDGWHICEFGYVLTDTEFRILEKDVFIINPKAKFHLPPRDPDRPFALSYPEETYKQSPLFPHFYDKIYSLLSDPSHLVCGFSILNDLRFLEIAYQKYKLTPAKPRFCDIQRLYACCCGVNRQIGLSNAVTALGIEVGDRTFHNSCCDAEFTMLVAKAIVAGTGKPLHELNAFSPAGIRRFAQRQASFPVPLPAAPKKSKPIYEWPADWDPIPLTADLLLSRAIDYLRPVGNCPPVLRGKRICVDQTFEQQSPRAALALIALIVDHGGTYVRKANRCNLFIDMALFDRKGKPINTPLRKSIYRRCEEKNFRIRICTLPDFLKLLSLTEEQFRQLPPPAPERLFPELAQKAAAQRKQEAAKR